MSHLLVVVAAFVVKPILLFFFGIYVCSCVNLSLLVPLRQVSIKYNSIHNRRRNEKTHRFLCRPHTNQKMCRDFVSHILYYMHNVAVEPEKSHVSPQESLMFRFFGLIGLLSPVRPYDFRIPIFPISLNAAISLWRAFFSSLF